ncbi:hypothetical protein C4587_01550 [Candidatus Parcubacteria bacterium]|nr:MAG: hypothetical protein C4587_01550 [Candidatus Parcubacteria bacterium]
MEQQPERYPLKKLLPNLTSEELKETENNLERYIQLVVEVYERIESDPAMYVTFKKELAKLRFKKRYKSKPR